MEEKKEAKKINWGMIIASTFGVIVVFGFILSLGGNNTPNGTYEDIKVPIGRYGSEKPWACNQSNGRCYDLIDFDYSGRQYSGQITRLHFPEGYYVEIIDSICEGTYCSVTDEDGTRWSVSIK